MAPRLHLRGICDGAEDDYVLDGPAGQPTVLAFYPGDETPVCTKQMCSYSDNLAAFEDLGARVWGISPQDLDSHRRFAEHRGLKLPLLADVDKQAARDFGVLGPLGLYRRSVIVVDAQGRVAWTHSAPVGLTYRSVAELTAALRGLPAAR